jgi:hypothetical protein
MVSIPMPFEHRTPNICKTGADFTIPSISNTNARNKTIPTGVHLRLSAGNDTHLIVLWAY